MGGSGSTRRKGKPSDFVGSFQLWKILAKIPITYQGITTKELQHLWLAENLRKALEGIDHNVRDEWLRNRGKSTEG